MISASLKGDSVLAERTWVHGSPQWPPITSVQCKIKEHWEGMMLEVIYSKTSLPSHLYHLATAGVM
jgi:hypothetical protein